MERPVFAPPPNVQDESHQLRSAPRTAVIAPPPAVESGATRRFGDLNIGRSSVIAPSPQLALDEQRVHSGRTTTILNRGSAQVIAPPPSLGASRGARSAASIIALSLHPSVDAPPNPPAGNRRGTFASTPEGHRGASGAAGTSTASNGTSGTSENGKASGSGSGKRGAGDVPSGLYVGKVAANTSPVMAQPAPGNSSSYSFNPKLTANAHPPRLASHTLQP